VFFFFFGFGRAAISAKRVVLAGVGPKEYAICGYVRGEADPAFCATNCIRKYVSSLTFAADECSQITLLAVLSGEAHNSVALRGGVF
jgi:hypothetical protein